MNPPLDRFTESSPESWDELEKRIEDSQAQADDQNDAQIEDKP